MKPLFYDIETLPTVTTVSILQEDGQGLVLANDTSGLTDVFTVDGLKVYLNSPLQRQQIKNKLKDPKQVTYGFNSHEFDDKLILDILDGDNPLLVKNRADMIINRQRSITAQFHPQITSLDLKEPYDAYYSLKKYEAFKGLEVKESEISFSAKNLTREELIELIHYNILDVKASISLYNEPQTQAYFAGKRVLIKQYGHNDPKRFRYANNNTTVAYLTNDKANTLKGYKPKVTIDYTGLSDEEKAHFKMILTNYKGAYLVGDKLPDLNYMDFDNLITISTGGLHGQPVTVQTHSDKTGKLFKKPHYTPKSFAIDDVEQLDVTSMYPSIIIKHKLLGDLTPKFARLVRDRIKNKKVNPSLAQAQKIIINSVYGLLRAEYYPLYNLDSAILTNVIGQISVLTLAKELSPYATILQVNTDGVTYKRLPGVSHETILDVKSKWETRTGLNLELGHFDRLIQKNISNYIAIDGDHVKLKGAEINRALKPNYTTGITPRIVQMAIYQKVVNGVDVLETLHGSTDLRDFTYIFTANAQKTLTGRSLDSDGNILANKVNRVYVSRLNDNQFFKEKKTDNPANYLADVYGQTLINNNIDNTDAKMYAYSIDYDYYCGIINEKLKEWSY